MTGKKLKKLAQQIHQMEKEMEQGKNIAYNSEKIDEIYSNLTLQELLEIEDYLEEESN